MELVDDSPLIYVYIAICIASTECYNYLNTIIVCIYVLTIRYSIKDCILSLPLRIKTKYLFESPYLPIFVVCSNVVFIWNIPEIDSEDRPACVNDLPYREAHLHKQAWLQWSGKGTHLSFFLTVMKGEYDALLQWPFKQVVTLMLLDQNKLKDVIQSFKPEPTSSSFQRPRNEMNVASGCPMFTPLSVLNNSSYVKDDTI